MIDFEEIECRIDAAIHTYASHVLRRDLLVEVCRELVAEAYEDAASIAERTPRKRGYTSARILGAIAYAASDIRTRATAIKDGKQ
jgi:hypothetical protein